MHFSTRVFGPGEEEIWRQFANEVDAEFLKGGFFGRPKVLARTRQWTITCDTYSVTRGGGPKDPPITYHYVRVRAPFRNIDGFRFVSYRHTILSPLEKRSALPLVDALLGRVFGGMREAHIGDPSFDHHFTIETNDQSKVRALFANERIGELMRSEPSILLQIQHPWRFFSGRLPKGVDELYLEVPGPITEVGDLYLHAPTGPTKIDPGGVGRLEAIDWETQRKLKSLASREGRKSLAVERLKTLYELFTQTLSQLWHIGSASPTAQHGLSRAG